MTDLVPVPPSPPTTRFFALDAARGAALVAMAIYHFAWDLSFFNLIGVDVANETGWRVFARMIAASFLVIVGISLVLATRNGFSRPAYLRRLALVTGAAASITLVTWLVFPKSFIFFGILHNIALASVLALPFLSAPPMVVILAAVLAVALPFGAKAAVFAHPALLWIGLSPVPPVTNDYVPLLPWFGAVLAGIAAARIALPWISGTSLAQWRPRARPGRALVWAGRRSLWVYLIHQPALIGLVWLAATVTGPDLGTEERNFTASCQKSCIAAGTSQRECESFCSCAADSLKKEGLWHAVLTRVLNDVERARLGEVTAMCRAR